MKKFTEEDLLKLKESYEIFQKHFGAIYEKYLVEEDLKNLEKELYNLARIYIKYPFVANYYVNFGDDLIVKGQNEAGILYLQIATDVYGTYADEITCFLRLAEYYIEKENMEKGISYLMKLCCETTDNYEESIEFRKLTQVWDKYRHLVEGKVPTSINLNSSVPLAPEKCSMQIQDILNLSKDEFLPEISTHLYEMSGGGACLNYLNKWERNVYYLDTLCEDINSDGIEHFVEYHGSYLKQTKKALEELAIHTGVQLLEAIQKKKKCRIDDFEDEETFYYEFVEKDLLNGLYSYVMSNKIRFR